MAKAKAPIQKKVDATKGKTLVKLNAKDQKNVRGGTNISLPGIMNVNIPTLNQSIINRIEAPTSVTGIGGSVDQQGY